MRIRSYSAGERGDSQARVWALLLAATGFLSSPPLLALDYQQGAARLTLEGFTNLAAGGGSDDAGSAFGFGELRLLGLYDFGGKLAVGPRVTYRLFAGDNTEDSARLGESSLLLLTDWGRFEYGRRRGLPDVLTGYAPNNYQFVSAEYGPASGPSLDPDGGLQTSLLSAALGSQLAPLTNLGITASFFGDESTKLIYVSPKKRGFLGGLSYAPHVDDTERRFEDLLQAGLTWERYTGQNVYRVGGTYAYASGRESGGAALRTDDLHSFSAGASATLDDALTLGVSFTYNGDSGLTQAAGPVSTSPAYGYAASVNYNSGAWTFGGFIQTAQTEGDTGQSGDDVLNAVQLGVSYRQNIHVRYFASLYLYDFDDEAGNGASGSEEGAVALVGSRLNF